MKYKISIFDILSDFVAQMTYPVTMYKIFSQSTNAQGGTNYVLNVDNVYHAVLGGVLSIPYQGGGSWNFTILGWNENYNLQDGIMQLTVWDQSNGTHIPDITQTFNFYPPFFAHGTVKEEGNQLSQQNSTWNKYPLIWAREPVKEVFSNDRDVAWERESDIEIYFLTDSNFSIENFNIYDFYVRPMTRLKDNFIKSLNTETGDFPIGSVDRDDMNITVTEITKVSVTIGQKDVTKTIFADNLSGVAAKFKLRILNPEKNLFGE